MTCIIPMVFQRASSFEVQLQIMCIKEILRLEIAIIELDLEIMKNNSKLVRNSNVKLLLKS